MDSGLFMRNKPNSGSPVTGPLEKDAGRVRKWFRWQVMDGLWNRILNACSFSGQATVASATSLDMGHTETLVELQPTPIGD
jgi:hypothetical protein